MTYKIGLTGGIGSGKTEASQIFSALGVPVIDADKMAHELVTPGQPALTKIIQYFGPHVLRENGELNRSALREIIFQDVKHKQWLEKLLHPLIYDAILKRLGHIHDKYCIVVIPLLAEHFSMYQNLLDHIIVIDVSEKTQLDRAVARDQTNRMLIQKIIFSQANHQKRLGIADTVLSNNGSLEDLKNKITNLHASILKMLS